MAGGLADARRRLAQGQAGNSPAFLIAPNRMSACKLLTQDAGSTLKGWRRSREIEGGCREREGGSEQVIVLYTQIYTAKVQNALSHINCLACTVQQMNQFLFSTARTGCEAFHFALLVSNMSVCFRNCQLISSKSPTSISRDQKLQQMHCNTQPSILKSKQQAVLHHSYYSWKIVLQIEM